MRPTSRLQPTLGSLRAFLLREGWIATKQTGRLNIFRPPQSLGLGNSFHLALPMEEVTADQQALLSQALATVAELYETDPLALLRSLPGDATVMSVRLLDPNIRDGAIALPEIESLLNALRLLLRDTAAFTATDDPILDGTPDIASYYLSQCRFLGTREGSFIADIELPEVGSLTLPEEQPMLHLHPDDFIAPTVGMVRARVAGAIQYAVERVLPGGSTPAPQELADLDENLLSVDVFGHVDQMFRRTHVHALEFGFSGTYPSPSLKTGPLDTYRLDRLSEFVEKIREFAGGTLPIDGVGRIVELRSRDPQRRRNHVGIQMTIDNREVLVAIRLGLRDYPTAIEAHRQGKLIHVAGDAIRMKTQLRITNLAIFEIAP